MFIFAFLRLGCRVALVEADSGFFCSLLPCCQLCCGFVPLSIFHFLNAVIFLLFKLESHTVFVKLKRLGEMTQEYVTFIIVSSVYFFSDCFLSALDLDSEESLSWCWSRAWCLISFFFSLSSETYWMTFLQYQYQNFTVSRKNVHVEQTDWLFIGCVQWP